MSHEAGRERPEPLSEKLKQLRDAEFAGGMAEFDVDAAIRGGRRRRRRRTVTEVAGAVAGVAVVVVVVVGGVLPGPGPDQNTVTAVATGPAAPTSSAPTSSVPAPRPAGPSLYSYTKALDTVTVFDGNPADGKVVAKITAFEIARGTANIGTASLWVEATADFTFSTDEFVWSGGGVDRKVSRPVEVTVRAGKSKSVRLRFEKAKGSELIWEPPTARGQFTWYQ